VSPDRTIRPFARTCEPPWWARGGHAQTILGHLLPNPAPSLLRSGTRTVALADGDQLVVHELAGTSGVRVLLLHGLSGDADSDYMRGAARALAGAGHDVWAVNLRGAGLGRGLARRPYHSGSSVDLAAVLAAGRAAAPERRQIVIGFSISGNIALLHAAQRLEPRADGVIAVNPPVDLARTAGDLNRGWNRIYERRFVARLQQTRRELEQLGVVRATGPIGRAASLRQFDERFTAPVSGFAGADEYYRRCSSAPVLERIETPTVILTAADDPLIDPAPLRAARLSGAIHVQIEPHGGHMGYLSRSGDGRWLDAALVHYVAELTRGADA
jgi:predicted alpha/beta-fold hydrolase